MAYVTDIRIGGQTVSNRIAAARAAIVTRFNQYRTYRNTLAELRQLSTRELDDLGLSRHTLRAIAQEAAYK